ncbi:DUF3050 domain-containing protein [Tumebacillus avium]|nr:DUF3050 domain-containing protein [Tumebacillus avium]
MQNSRAFETVRDELLLHPVYKKLTSAEHVRLFMEHHVFAVWDFMRLLKRLQRELTVTDVPWLEAMEEAEADTAPIRGFLDRLRKGMTPWTALESPDIPESVRQFVNTTLDIALHGKPHQVAAAFFYGREDIIPDMFTHLVRELEESGKSAARLLYYLKRHIELDGDEHGPLAERLLSYLCAGDAGREREAMETAEQSLRSRIKLWDGVADSLTT